MHTIRHIIQCEVDNKKKKNSTEYCYSLILKQTGEQCKSTHWATPHPNRYQQESSPPPLLGGDSSDPRLFLARTLFLIFPSPSLRIFPIFPQGKIWRRLVNFGREDYPSLEVNCLISSMSCAAKCLWIHQNMSVVPLPDGGWILRLTEHLWHVFIPPTSGT